ncbi:CBU_0592 family membrane protein [Gillisia sp. JM1]|uniref:CBU_0592 family membrane protein n=1 Tax=Gillisia sp. JM1 TaxID=1283286 RepID=UPI00054D63F7
MNFHSVIGSIGVALLLLAYVLVQLKKVESYHLSYAILNFLRATLAMWSSCRIDFMPFVVHEGTWVLISLQMIIKNKNKN